MVSTVVCYQVMLFRDRKGPGKDVPRVLSSYQVAGDRSDGMALSVSPHLHASSALIGCGISGAND